MQEVLARFRWGPGVVQKGAEAWDAKAERRKQRRLQAEQEKEERRARLAAGASLRMWDRLDRLRARQEREEARARNLTNEVSRRATAIPIPDGEEW